MLVDLTEDVGSQHACRAAAMTKKNRPPSIASPSLPTTPPRKRLLSSRVKSRKKMLPSACAARSPRLDNATTCFRSACAPFRYFRFYAPRLQSTVLLVSHFDPVHTFRSQASVLTGCLSKRFTPKQSTALLATFRNDPQVPFTINRPFRSPFEAVGKLTSNRPFGVSF